VSVTKTPSGRWVARERTGGRGTQRLSRTFDRKADAETWAAQARRLRQLGQPITRREPVTLEKFIDTYWTIHAEPNLAKTTRASYLNVWGKHIHPRLGPRDLRSITPSVVSRFRVDLEHAGVGAPTVKKALAFLQSVYTVAVVEELVDFNPVAAVKKPLAPRSRRPVIFQPSEVEKIRAGLSPVGQALVSVLAYAGPRPEEALRLRWRDVGSESLHFVDTKRHRERWTPLLSPLAGDLRAWKLLCGVPGPDAPVFPQHDGQEWSVTSWRNWRRRKWRGVAPAGSRPRDLRSSYITVQVYAGVPLGLVARWVGTSVQMIDRHYFEEIAANWDGVVVSAEDQILAARDANERKATG
jgi:integrase